MEVYTINKKNNLNEEIRADKIRLVGEKESEIVNTKDALNMAREQGMDLVAVSPQAKPPVCKIMNYSKFLYEQSKKAKQAKKNQKIVELKEVRLSATIEENDIEIKANNARKFLAKGNKVKVSIRFRGRQNNYTSLGRKVFDTFLSKLDESSVVERAPKLEGNNMFMILAPKK
ncbi:MULTISPECIES: translation initiation factor IF-3 [Clostridium]|uniref:Translation initiation factor IF-3 n=3 Tax=Clostridium TaxID=1485 RepID=A0A166ULV8_9CLOT|nr:MULTISPECIES: translation initiation factor IF-3 [Clostridium]AGY74396.1 translation initiation factor IF-3 [Clostridium autoethanogenum DSM 10061]ALU34583.1 Translation initiation factor IF-3 [Clostridium autoethanogenum DSM 10061]OAA88615.1 Translation initiation factor IF-3 [Clostridium ljungdahlii DSM 13528]OAA95039.1 Translation initiation factor IF-3 [Clostridium coskatii]OBR94254.1 translation initiation factor IF-3 [Clostridium coskatii]